MPTIIQTHLFIEPNWAGVMKKAKNLEHIIQNATHWLLSNPFYKVQVQFPAYIHTLHNPKIKILTIFLSHSKVQKVEEERNQVKQTEISGQPQPPPSPRRRRRL